VPDSPIQQIVCYMGDSVAGNPTQFMMERAFAAAGLDWRYLTLEVTSEHLAHAILGMRAMGFRGGNIAIPHKVHAIQFLDGVSDSVELMGIVNCVTRVGQRLIGENTDGKGFIQSLRSLRDPVGSKVVIVGAGGIARAIAVELGLSGAEEIVVINRSAERGQALVDLLNERVRVRSRLVHSSGECKIEPGTDIVVNATSIGLADPDARVPLDIETLAPDTLVADVIINPPRTRLLRDAESRGCKTLGGLGMLVNQGVISFKIWTGVDPDPDVMQEALEEYLEI
jgi:shikimate dehydrogenase